MSPHQMESQKSRKGANRPAASLEGGEPAPCAWPKNSVRFNISVNP